MRSLLMDITRLQIEIGNLVATAEKVQARTVEELRLRASSSPHNDICAEFGQEGCGAAICMAG